MPLAGHGLGVAPGESVGVSVTSLTTRLLLVADTHLGLGAADRLTSLIAAELAAADAVLHAGDLTHSSVLEALSAKAPQAKVYAVAGNNDRGLGLPERLALEIGGCAVAMIHDSGPVTGRSDGCDDGFRTPTSWSSDILTSHGMRWTCGHPTPMSNTTSTPAQPFSAGGHPYAPSPTSLLSAASSHR